MSKLLTIIMLCGIINTVHAVPQGFVYRYGRHFALNGNAFYYSGTNEAEFLLTDSARVDRMVAQCIEHKVNVLRCWGFANGTGWSESQWDGDQYSLQPAPGTFNDNAFRRIDYALAQAGAHNIRVIFVLVNNWENWYHGEEQWYVDKELGAGKAKSSFYTNTAVKENFKKYIHYVVNRTNTCTGTTYANDSAIFCWQLCNEPRNTGASDGTVLYNWVNEIAGYIKSLDTNHMVSTGEEGGGPGGPSNYTGTPEGVDLQKNSASHYIDYACIHLYPTHWGFTTFNQCFAYFSNRKQLAHTTLGKPVVLEEFGIPLQTTETYQTPWTNGSRNSTYSTWLQKLINEYDYDGFNVWQMSDINNMQNPDFEQTNWDFDFSTSTADTIRKYGALQMAKSGAPIDTGWTPINPAATPEKAVTITTINHRGIVEFCISGLTPENENIPFEMYTSQGRLVNKTHAKIDNNGTATVSWNYHSDNGCEAATGLYIIRAYVKSRQVQTHVTILD